MGCVFCISHARATPDEEPKEPNRVGNHNAQQQILVIPLLQVHLVQLPGPFPHMIVNHLLALLQSCLSLVQHLHPDVISDVFIRPVSVLVSEKWRLAQNIPDD